MKTQMVYIFNDRNCQMFLQLQNCDNSSDYQRIPPQTSKLVQIQLGEGQIPYLKIWETGQALLSGVDPSVLPKD